MGCGPRPATPSPMLLLLLLLARHHHRLLGRHVCAVVVSSCKGDRRIKGVRRGRCVKRKASATVTAGWHRRRRQDGGGGGGGLLWCRPFPHRRTQRFLRARRGVGGGRHPFCTRVWLGFPFSVFADDARRALRLVFFLFLSRSLVAYRDRKRRWQRCGRGHRLLLLLLLFGFPHGREDVRRTAVSAARWVAVGWAWPQRRRGIVYSTLFPAYGRCGGGGRRAGRPPTTTPLGWL